MIGMNCGFTVLVLGNAQSIMHIVFQLYDVLRFDSVVVINCLSIYHPQSKQPNFLNFEA